MFEPRLKTASTSVGRAVGPRRNERSEICSRPLQVLQRALGNEAFGVLQAKLTLGQPSDKYEQEADRVADAVMRMGKPQVQRQDEPEEEEEEVQAKPLADQITPLVQSQTNLKDDEEEEEGPVQAKLLTNAQVQREDELKEEEEEVINAKAAHGQTPDLTPGLETRINTMRSSGGRPLDPATQAFMESRFGYDFNRVRVHTGSRDAETARALNARAFTVDWDVAFSAGQYAPRTIEGKKLLAHELAHVAQQVGGVRRTASSLFSGTDFHDTDGSVSRSPTYVANWLEHWLVESSGTSAVIAQRILALDHFLQNTGHDSVFSHERPRRQVEYIANPSEVTKAAMIEDGDKTEIPKKLKQGNAPKSLSTLYPMLRSQAKTYREGVATEGNQYRKSVVSTTVYSLWRFSRGWSHRAFQGIDLHGSLGSNLEKDVIRHLPPGRFYLGLPHNKATFFNSNLVSYVGSNLEEFKTGRPMRGSENIFGYTIMRYMKFRHGDPAAKKALLNPLVTSLLNRYRSGSTGNGIVISYVTLDNPRHFHLGTLSIQQPVY